MELRDYYALSGAKVPRSFGARGARPNMTLVNQPYSPAHVEYEIEEIQTFYRLWHFSELRHQGARMGCLLTTCGCSLVEFKLAAIA